MPDRVLPSLAELAEDPGKVAGLPRAALCELLRTARMAAATLEYHLALLPAFPAIPAPQEGHEPDRRLSQQEAAEYLGVSLRWLRGHPVPGKLRLGRNIVYDARTLRRYLRQRQHP